MRLSEAMALGRTLESMNCHHYENCALGVSLAAIGVPERERSTDELKIRWPWLAERPTRCVFPDKTLGPFWGTWYQEISHAFICIVQQKEHTLDELIDFIRSIEPPERVESVEVKEILETVNV